MFIFYLHTSLFDYMNQNLIDLLSIMTLKHRIEINVKNYSLEAKYNNKIAPIN